MTADVVIFETNAVIITLSKNPVENSIVFIFLNKKNEIPLVALDSDLSKDKEILAVIH